mmetsp:Transcript_6434/g.11845  ORF Transcript_6434/g.11845 Transcript_6434/m.11845 type:complete len:89 (+) Transcript_6434:769-1035(+)
MRKLLVQPINLLWQFYRENKKIKIIVRQAKLIVLKGNIVGFDEHMNIVLDSAVAYNKKFGIGERLGLILIRGREIAEIYCNAELERPL